MRIAEIGSLARLPAVVPGPSEYCDPAAGGKPVVLTLAPKLLDHCE